ncbi:biliverdin-producing heme oxygenase, partial [Xanthomonas sp. Kuri4-1]
MSPPLADAAVPTAAQLLRHATREAHDAVEQVPLMRELGAARLDVDAYRQVLRRHHAILAGWEQALHGWLAT